MKSSQKVVWQVFDSDIFRASKIIEGRKNYPLRLYTKLIGSIMGLSLYMIKSSGRSPFTCDFHITL